MDLGGETGRNPDIKALLERHGYVTQPTGAGALSHNPTAERPHQTIANGIRVMLHGAALACKYWEYAFYFFLRVHTVLPHGTNTISSYHTATHKPSELSRLQMFGCTIYDLAPKKRMAKLTMDNVACGIFLGYGASMKTFIYENVHTHRICRATHATFDEAELNTLPKDLSPNSKTLWNVLSRHPSVELPASDEILTPPETFCVFAESSPFIRTHIVVIPILCIFNNLGLILESDPLSRRNVIRAVHELSLSAKIDWEHDLRYRTIVQVDETPVFLVKYVSRCLYIVDIASQESVHLIVADYKQYPQLNPSLIPHISLDQMRAIHHILHGWSLSDPVLRVIDEPTPVFLVTADNAGTMAQGQKHTRRTCLKGPHREKWVDPEFAHLDKHNSYGMYGPPLLRSDVPSSGTVVRPIWTYSQKGCDTFKARECMNGKQLFRMGHSFEHTYAACMEQHCLRLFVAFVAQLGFLIKDGDVVNAYAHADAEGPVIYLIVDDVYQAW
jgi:hypothetical protein